MASASSSSSSPLWRRPDFLDRAREIVSAEQHKRLCKLFTDEFFVISRDLSRPDRIELLVSGSKRDVYVVKIENDQCKCSCPDMKIHARRHNCLCKHVCFVWFKILNADNFGLFENHHINAQDVRARLEAAVSGGGSQANRDPGVQLADLLADLSLAKARINEIVFVIAKPPADEDDCPICFEGLLGDQKDHAIVGCPECKNNVHVKCITKWLQMNASKTCVYCRSPAWKQFSF